MSSQHIRQALVHLRGLVGTAAEEHDALLAEACLHRRPVHLAGLQLLLDPDLLEAGVGMVRAGTGVLEHTRAVAIPARPALASPDTAGSLRATHHAAGTVHRREKRLLVVHRLDALENDRLVAHRTADEALLAGTGGRAALADHPVGP